jgi:hypothetical protein
LAIEHLEDTNQFCPPPINVTSPATGIIRGIQTGTVVIENQIRVLIPMENRLVGIITLWNNTNASIVNFWWLRAVQPLGQIGIIYPLAITVPIVA